MKQKQKIYIKGSKDRPEEVRRILKQHGGNAKRDTNFTYDDYIYYIKHNGIVDYTAKSSELYKMITEYYQEIKLPEDPKDWKTGDILVNDSDPNKFYVFDKFSEKGNIIIHLKIIKSPIEDDILNIDEIYQLIPYNSCHTYASCHKANAEELKIFYSILATKNLTWDAYNKELLHGDYTYFYPKNGHYYFKRNTIRCKDRTTGEWYNAVLYSDVNGKYVREANDFNNKFKKL